MAGYIGSRAAVATSGVERKKTFAITTTTTSLTGLDYTPNHVHVFHNGIRLVDGTDYTATNGTSITLVNAAENGDEVVVVSYGTFSPADTYTKTEADDRYVNASGDTMTGTLVTPYQVINGDVDFIGMSIRNTKADYSTSFIDAQNRNTSADSHIFFHHNADGSSTISFGTQPSGDFTDRRIGGQMIIDGWGRVTKPWQPIWGGRHSGGNLNDYVTMYNDAAVTNGSGWVLSGGNNERLYPPVSGWYQVTMQALANGAVSSLGHTQAMLYKNGVSQYNLCAGTTDYTRMIIHAYLYLTPSDWISFYTAGSAMHTDQAYNKVTCMLVA